MKKVVLLFLCLFVGLRSFGQTSYGIINSTNGKEAEQVNTNQISVNAIWFGSKLTTNITDNNPLNENFILTGKILYIPISDTKWALPIVVTAAPGSTEVFSAESGYNIGIYPYYKLFTKPTVTLLAHGGVAYKAIEKDAYNLQQIRILGGLEIALFSKTGGAPVTVSATPVYTHTDGGIGGKTFLELSGVLPIAKGLGLLIDWQSGTTIGSGIKAGIITNLNAK